jgi:cytochrome c-type biogenesis protein
MDAAMSSLPLSLAAFLAGLFSFLGPCVLPLVPGYVSLISGAGVEELKQPDARLLRRVLLNSACFILGFSLVFMSLGAAASGLGQAIGRHLGVLSKIAGAVLIVLGLHQTRLLPIKALYRDRRLHGLSGGSSAGGSFVAGFAFAFGWTPCVGPILAAILSFAAAEATVAKGVSLLAVYSLGLAVPFLLTALGIDRFLGLYGRFRRYLHAVEVAGGSLLMVVGVLIFTRHFTVINSWLSHFSFLSRMAEKLM